MSKTQQILLTRQQVADLGHVNYKTIRRAEEAGELKSIKLVNPKTDRVRDNRPVRFRIGDVAEFLGVTVEDVRGSSRHHRLKGIRMTKYLVTDTDIRSAINAAISEQDKDPQGDNYVIAYSMDVVNHVLRLLDRYKVAESEQTEKTKQDSRSESDMSEYPVIRIEDIKAADLVDMICDAYRNGLAD